jgi:hypothetical protein
MALRFLHVPELDGQSERGMQHVSLMPKLAPQICSINKNFAVISFASGKTEDNLISMIDNGMYDMVCCLMQHRRWDI